MNPTPEQHTFRRELRADAYPAAMAELTDDERRRLDAAQRLIEQGFGVRADLYYRANEQPGVSVKLDRVIEALVLNRAEWENPEFAERRWSFTRGQLIEALSHLEAAVPFDGRKEILLDVESMADAIIEGLEASCD